MRITLIRHLPTEWNKKTWLQGRRDIPISPLTADIILEIEKNKKHLKQLQPFDIVLASTLKRTRQTAEAYGCECTVEALADELDFGPFEGCPKERLFIEHGGIWIENPKGLVLGESLENLEQRIILFLKKYQKLSNILVFSHGSWTRALISWIRYGDIDHMNKITIGNNECITLDCSL